MRELVADPLAGDRFGLLKGVGLHLYEKFAGILCFDPSRASHVVSLSGAAKRLGIDRFSVKRLLDQGVLPAQRFGPRIPTIIKVSDLDNPNVRDAVRTRRSGSNSVESHPGQGNLPFSDSN